MQETIVAKILSFLPKRKVRIEKGDVLVLDPEDNIYLYRLGKGKISLNGNENLLPGISISSTYGKEYGSIRVLEELALVVSNALRCNFKRVYDLDIKCRDAIMLY